MISNFPSPILSVAADVVKDLEGEDALCSLWALFTKCKESLKDGRRLENISWRLWYRELALAQGSPSSSPGSLSPPFSEDRSPSPITPVSEDGLSGQQARLPHPSLTPTSDIPTAYSWHAENSANTVITAGRRLSTASAPMERRKSHSSVGVGKMILDILPDKLDVNTEKEKAARSPTRPPTTTVPRIAQPRPVVATLPKVQLPATPPQPERASFPRVVVVNPTPHPTPPATPSVSHPPTVAAQPSSSHLLPPPPARSLISATAPKHLSGSSKPPSPPRATASRSEPLPREQARSRSQHPVASSSTCGSLTSKQQQQPAPAAAATTAASDDAIPTEVAEPKPKPKKYDDETLKASDRRFFLQDAGSLSPERPPSSTSDLAPSPSPTTEDGHGPQLDDDEAPHLDDHGQAPDPSPSSATSSHLKSEMAGHTGAAAGGGPGKRPRVQVRKGKERHVPVRPALQRLHSHGLRTASSQKKAQEKQPPHTADAKKTTFNIGSVSSNGSRSGGGGVKPSKAVEKEKAKEKEREKEREREKGDRKREASSSRTRGSSPAPHAPPKKSASTPYIPAAAAAAATKTNAQVNNSAGPSQQRRGIVITTSSEYDSTETDDDSEWASEDSGEDREKDKAQQQAKAKAKAAEETRLRGAAEEAQRQRDMFAKVPKRSYSNLNRVQSGLLSQLLNPDPNIFPPNHPYRASRSTQDMTQLGRPAAASNLQMQLRKSAAAVPLAAQVQVTAQAPSPAPAPAVNGRQGVYRPQGRPQDAEMEDSSDDDENPDDTIQVSLSLAQQKLAALADPNRRRHSDRALPTQHQQQQQQMQQMQGGGGRPQLQTVATAPIPLSHPYNLPAPAPPMTPKTTRRQMLQTELSESLRRNLLWERQVSRINMTRRVGVLGGGLRPLTSMIGEAGAPQPQQQQAQGSGLQHPQQQQQQQREQEQQGDDKEEKRRRAMARNRSWADEYHYSGW